MRTLTEIEAALAEAEATVLDYFGSLPMGSLLRRSAGGWAPLDDLRHLNRSVAPVARALGMPRIALRLRFGRAGRASMAYDELKARYEAGLRGGFKATPAFVPPPPEFADPEAYRSEKLDHWRSIGRKLRGNLARWTEKTIDRYVLPHPALGGLTIREMLFFTHIHNLHHVEVARRRVAERPDGAS